MPDGQTVRYTDTCRAIEGVDVAGQGLVDQCCPPSVVTMTAGVGVASMVPVPTATHSVGVAQAMSPKSPSLPVT